MICRRVSRLCFGAFCLLVFVLYLRYLGAKNKQTEFVYPKSWLLNLQGFKYLINNDVCKNENIFGIIFIHSHPANRKRRDVMRKNLPTTDLEDLGLRRVFLFGKAEWDDQVLYKKTSQIDINDENILYHDVIQGNFKEHYHNLTYKHVMGLKWSAEFCKQAKFIIKMDDDIIVDMYRFRDRLKYRYYSRSNLILGLLQIESRAIRDITNKWYVKKEEYPYDLFPNFVSGWVYAMTMDSAMEIIEETYRSKFFWIDDVFITGILAEKAAVKREGLNSLYTIHTEHMHCCLQFPRHADYYCDFYAGPSEGSISLMEGGLAHARSCYMNPCMHRKSDESLVKTCVQLEPLRPLGVGQGQVVKLYK